jgi:hypothetical protein
VQVASKTFVLGRGKLLAVLELGELGFEILDVPLFSLSERSLTAGG